MDFGGSEHRRNFSWESLRTVLGISSNSFEGKATSVSALEENSLSVWSHSQRFKGDKIIKINIWTFHIYYTPNYSILSSFINYLLQFFCRMNANERNNWMSSQNVMKISRRFCLFLIYFYFSCFFFFLILCIKCGTSCMLEKVFCQ